ncbi:triphosphoribosyl-dephospho-CoA synthase [Methylocapsa palsarum]|uniref:Triphosphoribosyl-dephospho-CoA synthase n=1 Tax=Methylocapsa palsarum TaxID=1612308 RepID=A0A1I3VU01_9HYPH|nr:triphosphoribosyl-dephospho-CoA synthase [Methylocapsa palsarum]SFJ98403.1 triphosphoribosyl-dephospho-CoA synthase [Methylocapsa palsarum]
MNPIAEAFIASCRDEIEAPKPGNVHVFADGHGMKAADFLISAEVAAPSLCDSSRTVGARILGAVEATWAAAGMNTNLGIILLCAPLAAAAQSCMQTDVFDLFASLHDTLLGLTRADAQAAFQAILLASPAGLGQSARHDVHAPVEATLLEAMRESAGRDRIAFQYTSDFIDVFETGFPALEAAGAAGWPAPWPAARVYLDFLADFPDSHVARKHGPEPAAQVQAEARGLRARLNSRLDPSPLLPDLLAFDSRLKVLKFNPGTSADLTVATVFAKRLTRILIQRRNDD